MKNNAIPVANIRLGFLFISTVSLIVSLYQANTLISMFLTSFTYFGAGGLTIYATEPNSEVGKKRRMYLTRMHYCTIVGLLSLLVIVSAFPTTEPYVMMVLRWLLMLCGAISVICVLLNDTQNESNREKRLSSSVRKKLDEDDYKENFRERDKRAKSNKETRQYVEKTEDKRRRKHG